MPFTQVATSPYLLMLYDLITAGEWDKATRLCRFIKDPSVWATLAAMAMASKELNCAEVAFAAIEELDKLQFVLKVPRQVYSWSFEHVCVCVACLYFSVHIDQGLNAARDRS